MVQTEEEKSVWRKDYYRRTKERQDAYSKEWREKNKEKVDRQRHEHYLRHQEKIKAQTKEYQKNNHDKVLKWGRKHQSKATEANLIRFEQDCQKQNGVCIICRKVVDVLLFDHDHDTNQYRGAICHHCNKMLGFAADNIGILQSAIEYLSKCKKEDVVDENNQKS